MLGADEHEPAVVGVARRDLGDVQRRLERAHVRSRSLANAVAAARAGVMESLTTSSRTKRGGARARDGGDEGADDDPLSRVLATAQGSERRRFAGPTRTDGGETKQERVAAAGRKE